MIPRARDTLSFNTRLMGTWEIAPAHVQLTQLVYDNQYSTLCLIIITFHKCTKKEVVIYHLVKCKSSRKSSYHDFFPFSTNTESPIPMRFLYSLGLSQFPPTAR